MPLFGSKDRFALVVGPFAGQLRTVEIWVNGTNLTSHDSSVYLPSFVHAMETTEHGLKERLNFLKHESIFLGLSVEEAFQLAVSQEMSNVSKELRVFDWGPTTDDYLCLPLPVQGKLYLACKEHASGSIHSVSVFPYDLIRTMQLASHELSGAGPEGA
jgi:hypothetical protein